MPNIFDELRKISDNHWTSGVFAHIRCAFLIGVHHYAINKQIY